MQISQNFILTPLFWFLIWAIKIAKDKPVCKTKLYFIFTLTFSVYENKVARDKMQFALYMCPVACACTIDIINFVLEIEKNCMHLFLLFRLGQTCSHIAALLFRIEAANRVGQTSCTANKCSWVMPKNVKDLEPCELSDLCTKVKKTSRAKIGTCTVHVLKNILVYIDIHVYIYICTSVYYYIEKIYDLVFIWKHYIYGGGGWDTSCSPYTKPEEHHIGYVYYWKIINVIFQLLHLT